MGRNKKDVTIVTEDVVSEKDDQTGTKPQGGTPAEPEIIAKVQELIKDAYSKGRINALDLRMCTRVFDNLKLYGGHK